MIVAHTFAQVIGSVCALVCGWLAFGPAGLGMIGGLILVLGSLVIETRPTRGRDE